MTVKKVPVQEVSFESGGETLPATLYNDTSVAVILSSLPSAWWE
jgi:hypothetical protein